MSGVLLEAGSVLPKQFLGNSYTGWFALGLANTSSGRNLEFGQGAADSSLTVHEGQCGMFNVH